MRERKESYRQRGRERGREREREKVEVGHVALRI